MHIRRLGPSDAADFQELRLRGLSESPTAFGSSYEEEASRPIPAIAASLAEDSGRNMFGAFMDTKLVGVVGVGRETSLKERHRGFVRSMYVAPEARRQGVGKALMRVAVDFAKSMPGLRQLTLAVTAGNSAAITTYEGFGFRVCGTAPEALHVQGRYYDELQMVCSLGDA
jgi:RimJ/RimL family protein N-acetyltransferase